MRIVFSGGGTGGHIIPNIAIINELRQRHPAGDNLKILYVGGRRSMEEKLVKALNIAFIGIFCGKLRRYFSIKNIVDFLKIPIGILQALIRLSAFKPTVIFCKGGYVCFPVAVAGWILRVPVILHEADVIPGLANRLCALFATRICIAFEESRRYFSGKKTMLTGNPVRREIAFGSREEGLRFLDFSLTETVIFFMGGSLGADFINQIVWRNFNELLKKYQVAHICGENHLKTPEELYNLLSNENKSLLSRYRIFPFVKNELKDIYMASDVIVCRGGAMTLAELDIFDKAALLIPLSQKTSRGDQIVNARVFAKSHFCSVFDENDFSDEKLLTELERLLKYVKKHQKNRPLEKQLAYFKKKNGLRALETIIRLLETT